MKKTLAAAVAAASLLAVFPVAQAATSSAPTTTSVKTAGAEAPSTATYSLDSKSWDRNPRQKFNVTAPSVVTITTTWAESAGSTKTGLYKSDSTWITNTGYQTSPYTQTIKQTLQPGSYEIRVEGDKVLTGVRTVTVKQEPVVTPVNVIPSTVKGYSLDSKTWDRNPRQSFTVTTESRVVIQTSWPQTAGSTRTGLYKSDSTWITNTGYQTSPYTQKIDQILKPGTYQIRIEGDKTLTGMRTVTVTQTPVESTLAAPSVTGYSINMTPQNRQPRQDFRVEVDSEVIINTSWPQNAGSTKTGLYKSDSTWVTNTGFQSSPYTQTIKQTLKRGTYQLRFEGDTALSGVRTVTIAQTPVPAAAPVTTTPGTNTGTTTPPVLDKVIAKMPSGAAYPFGPQSEWKRDISTAPLASNSAAVSANLADQVKRYYGAAALNAYQYNSPWYQVPATQKKVDMKFYDCQRKNYTPGQLFSSVTTYDNSVSKTAQVPGMPASVPGHFTGVPIPDDAVPSKGTDKSLVVYSPSTDQLWEFWVTEKRADGWYACWGGRIDQASKSKGYFLNGMGTSATGLASAAGAISIDEAKAGKIDHALSLIVAEPQKGVFSWPAQRTDGWNASTSAPMEGQRLRLDPSFNVDASNMHPFAKMVAKAAQKYGVIVTDKGGAVAFVTEEGGPTQRETGVDPWKQILTKPGATKDTPTYEVFKNFPWDKMQVLPKDYGKP